MTTELIESIDALRERIRGIKCSPATLGCVPTMGALHAGHIALIERARSECDFVVVTLFVNPLQFDRKDDLNRYPQNLEDDLRVCSQHGVDVMFAPSVQEMYPRSPTIRIEVDALGSNLCGASRPGHFQAVAIVVLKLLNLVLPDKAYFGEKDYQQLVIVQRLVQDINQAVCIVPVETVRDRDGLALSSRNKQLNEVERKAALLLIQSLRAAKAAIESGERDAVQLIKRIRKMFKKEPLLHLDYFQIVDPDSLEPIVSIRDQVRIMMAASVGKTRLIDNLSADPPDGR